LSHAMISIPADHHLGASSHLLSCSHFMPITLRVMFTSDNNRSSYKFVRYGSLQERACEVALDKRREAYMTSSFPLPCLQSMLRSRVLIFSATKLYRHDSIPTAIEALKKRADEIDVQFDATEDDTVFSDASLEQYNAILFLSTSGDGNISFSVAVIALMDHNSHQR
jgi:hypothetical protein